VSPRLLFAACALFVLVAPVRADPPAAPAPPPAPVLSVDHAVREGVRWLDAHQAPDGSWGKQYSVAITALACLAHLSASDQPFAGEAAAPLAKGLGWLLAQQTEGRWPHQGHTWIHGQGFATLALAEAHGKVLFGAKPDLDTAALRAALAAAVKEIEKNQSQSGGWWYVPGSPGQHEGSTTVCAVQALVSASNFGVATDEAVLERGFEYLKRCQNPDGGFDYQEGPGTQSMKEGTAADVATLALMKRFDYEVMTKGVDFLVATGTAAISAERFPYYGHFYASMGLRLFGEEMAAEAKAAAWFAGARDDLLSWRQADGSWPQKGWMATSGGEADGAYATAFACLVLAIPEARLSILHRTPPQLPKAAPTPH
jgi:hypothetical protein